jgi:hypothetical protein
MIEQILVERYLYDKIALVVPDAEGIFRSEIPSHHTRPAIVFEFPGISDVLTQERSREWLDFEVDVLAYTARGTTTFPHELAQTVDDSIVTTTEVDLAFEWQNQTLDYKLTCDRIRPTSFKVKDEAGDYLVSGGRYNIRVQLV